MTGSMSRSRHATFRPASRPATPQLWFVLEDPGASKCMQTCGDAPGASFDRVTEPSSIFGAGHGSVRELRVR